MSMGSVRLASSSPADAPVFDVALLRKREDEQRMAEAVRLAVRVFKSKRFGGLIADFDESRAVVEGSDAAALAFVRRFGAHAWHVAGSVRMGSDAAAPVDTSLRVRGCKGLRVVDASVMPRVISGNTQIPSMLIGSRGAEIVLAEHAE
eukprot:TRINITY_DN1875_c0_g2_i1.p3 TRINITY_DN1875_c0_g2~~TRINITY_DN1875_c0_g2_i1.p3  ORF type:complete len:148 (-),score=90.56 TRINITY_DN1875_c0_g2_i1:54-497(-)